MFLENSIIKTEFSILSGSFTLFVLREYSSQIYTGDPRPPLSRPVVSKGAQILGFKVFADHTCKNKHNTNASMIFARRAVFYACLSSHSDHSRCR